MLVGVSPYLDLGDATPRGKTEVRDLPRCNNPYPCADELYSASTDFTELCLRTITSVEVSPWTGGCASGNRKIRTQYSLV